MDKIEGKPIVTQNADRHIVAKAKHLRPHIDINNPHNNMGKLQGLVIVVDRVLRGELK